MDGDCPEWVGRWIRNRPSRQQRKEMISEGTIDLMNEINALKNVKQCLCIFPVYISISVLSNWGHFGFVQKGKKKAKWKDIKEYSPRSDVIRFGRTLLQLCGVGGRSKSDRGRLVRGLLQ